MDSSPAYDLAVVGAGPAGSSAARRASQLGLRVLLVDKAAMPREKTCGGAVSKQAQGYLDFSLPRHLLDSECYGARVRYGTLSSVARCSEPIAVLVSRERFDSFLLHKAQESGAKHLTADVRGVQEEGRTVLLRTPEGKVRARAAILAHGAHGNLYQRVRPPDTLSQSGICLEARIPAAAASLPAGLLDIYFGVSGFGYGWVFPHGSYCSVGVGGLRDRFPRPREAFEGFCKDLEIPAKDIRARGHFIPCGGVPRTLVASRLFLAGDAAGFVDPFNGEGIAYAIRSGQLAAESVHESLRGHEDFSAGARSYTSRCHSEFGKNLGYSLLLSRLMHRFPGLLLRILAGDRRVLERYLDVPLRDLSYQGFLAWLTLRMPVSLFKGALHVSRMA